MDQLLKEIKNLETDKFILCSQLLDMDINFYSKYKSKKYKKSKLLTNKKQKIKRFKNKVLSLNSKIIKNINNLKRNKPDNDKKDDNNITLLTKLFFINDKQYEEINSNYCYCNKSFNDCLILCGNDNCRIKWYHINCVDIRDNKKYEDKDWFCYDCLVRK